MRSRVSAFEAEAAPSRAAALSGSEATVEASQGPSPTLGASGRATSRAPTACDSRMHPPGKERCSRGTEAGAIVIGDAGAAAMS